MSKHTPGPWIVGLIRGELGAVCFDICQHSHTAIRASKSLFPPDHDYLMDEDGYIQPDESIDCSPHRIANARLIAAAPDLLEALEKIVGLFEPGRVYDFKEVSALTHEALSTAMTAIAKAKGE